MRQWVAGKEYMIFRFTRIDTFTHIDTHNCPHSNHPRFFVHTALPGAHTLIHIHFLTHTHTHTHTYVFTHTLTVHIVVVLAPLSIQLYLWLPLVVRIRRLQRVWLCGQWFHVYSNVIHRYIYTCTQTHTQIHTYIHESLCIPAMDHKITYSQFTYYLSSIHSHTLSLSLSYTHIDRHTLSHTLSITHTHTHTHKDRPTCSYPPTIESGKSRRSTYVCVCVCDESILYIHTYSYTLASFCDKMSSWCLPWVCTHSHTTTSPTNKHYSHRLPSWCS
jgi:hypothetical protein